LYINIVIRHAYVLYTSSVECEMVHGGRGGEAEVLGVRCRAWKIRACSSFTKWKWINIIFESQQSTIYFL